MNREPHVWLLLITALCIVAATALALNGTDVPTQLWELAFGSLTGAAGAAIPARAIPPPPG